MNLDERLLVEGINEFNNYVHYLDQLIRQEYSEDINPVKASTKKIISKQGVIKDRGKEINYRFHGRGCCFVIDSRVVDFDYTGDNWLYEGFGIHKLHEFLLGSEKYETFKDLESLIALIEVLENKKILYRINPPYATFNLHPAQSLSQRTLGK